ncbi:MAG TPA: prepilin peptidase [Solirubrobacteraceae bacterium]|jgi:leader peptidase (prepilin peptidase)/N-methyltransferase|nr:prepilin peptidase [Solirubrobacteraceae bacterium]
MTTAYVALAAVFGAIVGSFLNVVAYRLPRGESLSRPGSHCPSCDVPIKPYDNVPVLAWLWLRGRCRNCGEPISARYPLVEAGTAVLCAGAVIGQHNTGRALLGIVLVLVLVPITLIDLDHQLIPDRITAPAAILAVVIGTALDPGGEIERLIAGAAAGGFLFVAWYAYPGGMGFGDVKLAAVLGLFLGSAVGPAMLVALVSGVVVGLAIMRRVGVEAGRKTKVPFGPFLALGGIVALYAGHAIVTTYLSSFGS